MNEPYERPFSLEVNLDDFEEMLAFLCAYEHYRGRALANKLKFKGKYSVRAANGLMNYAQNRRAAALTRHQGRIDTAIYYDNICDRIYREDIQPLIACW